MSDDDIKRRCDAVADLAQSLAVAAEERHERQMAELRTAIGQVHAQLLRAVRLSVEEARRERVRRKEGDEKLGSYIAELTTTQKETERKLQAFLDSLRRSGTVNRANI